jgi:[acyl-carrier-protein] S-malonyltransferase
MGRELYERVPSARELFQQADDLLGFALSHICFEGPEEQLTDTVNQQPALFVTSMATLAAVQAAGWPAPDFVAGHSLGEISALVAAGSLSFADGLRLVRTRGELMKRAGTEQPGSMAAVLAADPNTVRQACHEAQQKTGEVVQIANDNCPGQIVISGGTAAVQEASALLTAAGVKRIVALPITIAAHSPLMASAAGDFAAAVAAISIAPPRVPVIGNTTAVPLTTAEAIRAELTAQLTGSVRWTESMQYLVAQGVDTIVEVGAGDTLQNLMKRIERGVKRISFVLETGE